MTKDEINSEYNSIIEKNVGLSLDKIIGQDCSEIQANIESRIHQKLTLGKEGKMDYRGSMLLALGLIDNNIDSDFDNIFSISK